MDSFEALTHMPSKAKGFLTCVLCLRVQGWITSDIGTVIKAADFIPALDYPRELPTSGSTMCCAWCGGGPCVPHAPNERFGDSKWKLALRLHEENLVG